MKIDETLPEFSNKNDHRLGAMFIVKVSLDQYVNTSKKNKNKNNKNNKNSKNNENNSNNVDMMDFFQGGDMLLLQCNCMKRLVMLLVILLVHFSANLLLE